MTNIRTFIFLGVVMSVTTFASYEASNKSFNGNIGTTSTKAFNFGDANTNGSWVDKTYVTP